MEGLRFFLAAELMEEIVVAQQGKHKAVFTFQLCCLLLLRWLQYHVPVFLVPGQGDQGEVWLWLQWSWILGRHQQKATRLQSDLLWIQANCSTSATKQASLLEQGFILIKKKRDTTQDCFIKCEKWYTCSTSSWSAGQTFSEGFAACHRDWLSWGPCSNNKWDCIDTVNYSRPEG